MLFSGNSSTQSSLSFLTAVVQRIVRYCCYSSHIAYGTFLRSNREAEDHFSDFTFPFYESKMNKDLYRDQPFVKVVTAPRVMLLVYDGPKVQSATTWLLGAIDYVFYCFYRGNKPSWDAVRDTCIIFL